MKRDFLAAWGPDDLHMNRAEGTVGGNVSDEYRNEDKLQILTTPICLLFLSGTGVNEEGWLHQGLLMNYSETHLPEFVSELFILHMRLVQHSLITLPVTGSVGIPSIDNLALQAFVQQPHVTDIDGQLHLECQVKTQVRGWRTTSHLESMAPRDSDNISPTKK